MKNSKEYLDKIINIIEKPYFLEMGYYGIDDIEEWEYVIRNIFGDDITMFNKLSVLFDSNNKILYFEESDGYWYKREYDINGDEIYFENSNGRIIDKR
jgi:hypothetical protein